MPQSGLRFAPPATAITPATKWVLRRAFGPVAQETPADKVPGQPGDLVHAGDVLGTARRLGLSARIAARLGRDSLAAELGAATAAEFVSDRAAIVARAMLLRETVREVATAAATAGVPIALLKFAALDASGVVLEGSRPAGDIDILVSEGRAGELAEFLVTAGFRWMGSPGYEHHLPALLGKHGVVELHRVILGVRLGTSRGSATLEQLAAAGLLQTLTPLPAAGSVPVAEMLAAHALVHGLGQHGFAPQAYPLATLLADLQDLGFSKLSEATLTNIVAWLRQVLPPAEIVAARDLVRALAIGDEPVGNARTLLAHLVAGLFDGDYAAALKLRQFRHPLSDRPALAATLVGLWSALRGPGPATPPPGKERPRGGASRLAHLMRTVLRALRATPARGSAPK